MPGETNSRKFYFLLIIGILFFADLFLIYDLYQSKNFEKKIREEVLNFKSSFYNQIELIENLKTYRILELKTENSRPFTYNDLFDDQRIALNDYSICFNKIILRITEFNCSTCIDEDLIILKRIISEIGEDNVIVFATFNNERNLISFRENHKLKIKIYNTKEINLPAEQANVPYFFRLDNTGSIKNVFMPLRQLPELTDIYLKELMRAIRM